MPVCKIFKITIVTGLSLFFSAAAVAQSTMPMLPMPEMPSMPEISATLTMPSMPAISSDSYSGSYYVPKVPGPKTTTPAAAPKLKAEDGDSFQVSTESTGPMNIFSDLLGSSSGLTASDISSLYDSGAFTDVTSLSGSFGGLLGNYGNNTALLQQILTELESLKSEQNKVSAAQQKSLEQQQADNETFKRREPSILRFKINGYSINDTLTTVFFSEPDSDGSFLLTADRKYFADKRARTETFYMLFKAVRHSGASTTYTVEPSIVQDSLNENSFMYKFCQMKNITAEKTGNLVVLKRSGNMNVDLLLDIDK